MSCMPDHPSGLPTVVSTGLSGMVCGDMRAALLQALRARVLSTEAAVDNELLVQGHQSEQHARLRPFNLAARFYANIDHESSHSLLSSLHPHCGGVNWKPRTS